VNHVEKRREQFRPKRISALFVGESPPHGGTFFYDKNSKLFFAMQKAFGGADTFLEDFKTKGFYLDDLALEPINHLGKADRNAQRWKYVPSLANRIREYGADAIVIVMCAIEPMVLQAISQSGLTYEPHKTAFPANGNQTRFANEMKSIVPQLPRREATEGK
jgi:hypothetical protein